MTTLVDALDAFLKVDRADSTNKQYRRVLTKFIDWAGPDTDLASITLSRLLDYKVLFKSSVSSLSEVTYTLALKSFFSWCEKVDLLEKSPGRKLTVRKPPRDPSVNRAIPPDDVERMCRVAYANPRDYALIHFFAATGARIGGVASLQLSRLSLGEGSAVLFEKGEQFVTVYFWGEAITAMRRWLSERPANLDHDYVFTTTGKHKPLSTSGIAEVVRRVALRACGREYAPHGFRHYVAQVLEAAGEVPYDIQHKLNHKDVRTTQGNYLRNINPHIQSLTRRNAGRTNPSPEQEIKPSSNIIYLDNTGS